MGRAASALADGAFVADAARPHHPAPATGHRETLETWSRTTLRLLRELEGSEVVASDGAVAHMADRSMLELLAKTLMELALLVGTSARRGADRHLQGCVPSSRHAQRVVAADVSASINARTRPTAPERPDVGSHTLPEGAVTILIVGADDATAANDHPGDRWKRSVLSARGASVREQLAAHGGVQLEAAGAAFAAAFASPRRAVLCAIGIQRTLAGHAAAHPEEPMRVRIALHTGAMIPEGTDRFGKTGVLAARIASQARGGEILVSAELKELTGSAGDLRFGPGRTFDIEGGRSCTVCEVCWAGEVTAPEAAGDVFRREGEYWTIAWGGRRCRVRDVRGLHYIAQLLRHPGREFHALDLVGVNGSGLVGARGNNGVAALDARAKSAYRRRLDDLRDDLEEAERCGDVGRAAAARAEREALTEELAAAVGLGGRDRVAAAASERARCTVTQGIRVALKRVRNALPSLADELGLRIKTGVYCVYVPDAARPTDWVL
jgi:class 3 adenylate cyclase